LELLLLSEQESYNEEKRLVERQLYFDGLLDSQSLAKIDLRVLVADFSR
jgi:hypothetical protein